MKFLKAVLVLLGAVVFAANAANLNVLGFKQPGEYLPIPSNANPFQPNQANGLHISEIEDDIFFVSDTAYTFCMIDIGTSLLVIDAPPSVTAERLREAVVTIGNKKKVSHFIYTHAHVDHVGLANSLRNKRKIRYVAHRLTAELLKRNPTVPTPSIIIEEDETKMTFGNKELEFYYYGNSHAEGNMLIWIPNSQVLICIDVVFPQWAPFYGLGVTQDAIRFMKQYEIILSFPFKHFITGHLGRTANRTDVVVALNFINDMKAIVTEGLKIFNNITAYYEKFGGNNPLAINHWAVLHNWEGDMATHCAQTLIDKYQGIMAGIDVYSWSNCWILREHLALFTPVE